MKIIDLYYLESTPLSTQLSRLSGDNWNALDWTNIDGDKASIQPGEVIKNKNTGQLFRLPKKQSHVIDYLYESWEFKMRALRVKDVIQISENTFDYLLGCVPPVRMGGGSFLVGEAMTHEHGKSVYCSCFHIDDKYFLTYQNLQEYDSKEYLKRYENHLLNYDLF